MHCTKLAILFSISRCKFRANCVTFMNIFIVFIHICVKINKNMFLLHLHQLKESFCLEFRESYFGKAVCKILHWTSKNKNVYPPLSYFREDFKKHIMKILSCFSYYFERCKNLVIILILKTTHSHISLKLFLSVK